MPLDLMAQRQLTNKHGRSHCTPEQHTTKVYNNENKINQMKSLLLKKIGTVHPMKQFSIHLMKLCHLDLISGDFVQYQLYALN